MIDIPVHQNHWARKAACVGSMLPAYADADPPAKLGLAAL